MRYSISFILSIIFHIIVLVVLYSFLSFTILKTGVKKKAKLVQIRVVKEVGIKEKMKPKPIPTKKKHSVKKTKVKKRKVVKKKKLKRKMKIEKSKNIIKSKKEESKEKNKVVKEELNKKEVPNSKSVEEPKKIETPPAFEKPQEKEEPKQQEKIKEAQRKVEEYKKTSEVEGEEYMKEYEERYLQKIREVIRSHLSYPFIARRMGWQGEVIIRITLDPEGNLVSLKVEKSSGFEILDKNALEVIKIAYEEFPRPKTTVTLLIPIVYRLR